VSLEVHAIEPRSRANGPGVRYVVWVQGCTLGCRGCYNPATHAAGGESIDIDVDAIAGVEGITVSGGEPLQQAAGVADLLAKARARGLSTLVFSGYALDEIRALPGGPDVLAYTDVLVDGRYVAAERFASGLRGSSNQRIHLLTSRYRMEEVEATPAAEIRIGPTGEVVLTGVNPLKLRP
jgi:anaerobic ribonucleoside-triphosphate reductase activating protein